MGSESSKVAINEIVFFLSRTDPSGLEYLRGQYPQLAGELKEGIYAGPDKDTDRQDISFIKGKAELSIKALSKVLVLSQEAKTQITKKIMVARKNRLWSQVCVALGSSSVLGTALIGNKYWTVLAAVITLLAMFFNLFAEHQERLLNPQNGNIYEAFQKLGEGAYRAQDLEDKLNFAMSHTDGGDDLKELISEANSLCRELNDVLTQLVVHLPLQ